MTTIINTPQTPQVRTDDGIGFFVGFILLAFIVVVFLVYGLPAIRNMKGREINIPNKIDVNINQQK